MPVLVWLVLISYAVHSGFTGRNDDPAGWWQVVIDLVGFPLIIYGLIQLQRDKPDIRIGVAFRGVPRDVRRQDPWSRTVRVPDSNPTEFQLVVQNRGGVVARFLKVCVAFDYLDAHRVTTGVQLTIPESSSFVQESHDDFTFVSSFA